MHPAQEYVVCRNLLPDKVPIFNRPVYLEDKKKVGVVDEVFGPINEFVSIFIILLQYDSLIHYFRSSQLNVIRESILNHSLQIVKYTWAQNTFYPSKGSYLSLKLKVDTRNKEEAVEAVEAEVASEETEVEEEASEEAVEETEGVSAEEIEVASAEVEVEEVDSEGTRV